MRLASTFLLTCSCLNHVELGALLFSGANIGGSAIGGIPQIQKMLQIAADKKPNFMIEKRKVRKTRR